MGTLRRKTLYGIAAALTIVALAAGCSSSGGTRANAGGSSGGKFSGPPIKVGIVGELSGAFAGGFQTEPSVGAKAAIDYVNNELNGFGGRKLVPVVCDAQSSAAGALTCANKFIAEKVEFVVGLSAYWGSNGLPTLAKAEIVNQTDPVQPQEVINPYSFPVGGGIFTEYPGQSNYAIKELHAKTGVAIISEGFPVAGDLFAKPWKAAGLTVHVVAVPTTSADLSSSVAKAVGYKPDAIVSTLTTVQTQQLFAGLASQGYDMSKVISTGATQDIEQFFSKVTDPSSVEGTLYSGEFASFDDVTDPEIRIYRHAMKTYSKSEGRAQFYQWGFSPIITDYLLAKKIGFDKFNKSTMKSALETQVVPIFTAYQYNRSTAPKDLPQLGASYIRYAQYKGGKLGNLSDSFLDGFTGEAVKRGTSPFADLPSAAGN